MFREFRQQDSDADSVVLASENDTVDSIKFGVDSNGKYGYIAPGADTVTPFKNQTDLDAAYQEGLESARIEWIATVIVGGSGSNPQYLGDVRTITFEHNYSQVVIIMAHADEDDSGDNFMKVYSSNKGYAGSAAPSSSAWTDTTDEWNYFKPTLSGATGQAGLAKTNTSHYSSTPNDNGKDIFKMLGGHYTMSCIAYKVNVSSGDTAYIYSSHGSTCHVLGIRTD